ncbi:MAG: hypothetical protein V3W37_02910 [Candidatus Binatia bacterium]
MPIGGGQILGGALVPRFAFIGDQLITNGDFGVDTTGWTFVGDAGGITRVADSYVPWGDYSAEVNDGDLSNYAYATTDVAMVTGGSYIASAWFRRETSNADNAYLEIQEPDSSVSFQSWGASKWGGYADQQYNVLSMMVDQVSGVGNGELHIYPTGDTVAATGKCYIARVRMWQILEWFTLGATAMIPTYLPSPEIPTWTPVFKHRHQNAGGARTREVLGYRYENTFAYPVAQDLHAEKIIRMASGAPMFLWPHYDPNSKIFFGLAVRCVGHFEANYPQKSSRGDGYIGRVMNLRFRSYDLVPTIPEELV